MRFLSFSSSYLAPLIPRLVLQLASRHASSIPVFWGYGNSDPLVKMQHVEESTDTLVKLGLARSLARSEPKGLTYNLYESLGHATNQRELDDLKQWIINIIPAEKSSK